MNSRRLLSNMRLSLPRRLGKSSATRPGGRQRQPDHGATDGDSEKVLVGGNVPRVNNVNFALSVGTAVPPPLIKIHPEWRGHMYFAVGRSDHRR